ncbi:GspH/FimT family pseudopilin [Halomonas borealis]|uniref:GspH/FimT family pseudopilin n=1 Tax=Halomonas borealis TaxID=2508710 RepID=UPI0010A0391E|nr:GspH/FimT family pseudopilin [Halomonas borealis]
MRESSGFTLIELLVTLAVVVILATVALPGFQHMLADNRVRSGYNEVLVGLNVARSEAIKRRQAVTFEMADAASWGYRVTVEDTSEPLRVRRAGDGMLTVDDEDFAVTFDALGKATNCTSGCRLTLMRSGADARVVGVSPLGRVGRGSSS